MRSSTSAGSLVHGSVIGYVDVSGLRKKGLALSGVVVESAGQEQEPLASGLFFRMTTIALRPIGKVESRLTDLADALSTG